MDESSKSDLRFIIDEPAEVDLFNTHSPLAAAIAKSIRANPLRIVGLLGRWGSGKSTIVREIAAKLRADDNAYVIFNYDSWLHQNDPVRRSFLEALVAHLSSHDLIESEKWEKELKKLSGSLEIIDTYETPIVTGEAKLFVILAAFIPIGISLLGIDTFEGAFGETVTRAGQWTARLATALIFAPILAWLTIVWFKNRRGPKMSYFPALIINKDFSHKNTQTTKPIEPTSIEFGRKFRHLMEEVQNKGAKLVIIIDNIDRIAEDEAMQIWANVRSFFLSSKEGDSIDRESYHPTVILPIDSKSIEHMFSIGISEDHGRRLANSFINKTFDVTFDVPPPVMSDWKSYLNHKMSYALGTHFSEERYFRTSQFLEAWFDKTSTYITPREINKALNKIVALLMQWENFNISYETIAYFSINRDLISRSISAEVSRTDSPLARFESDWARQLAALHFGVDVDHAAQVLMTGPIRSAFLTGEASDLEPYRNVSGFGDIFESVTANLPSDEKRPAPNFEIITNAASLLMQQGDDGVWQASAWKNLVGAFNEIDQIVFPELFAERIPVLFDRVDGDDAASFAHNVEAMIDKIISAVGSTRDDIQKIGEVGALLINFAKKNHLRDPIFDLTGTADEYLTRLGQISSAAETQRRVRTSAKLEQIAEELVRRISDPERAADMPQIIALLTSPSGDKMLGKSLENLKELVVAAENVARSQPPDSRLCAVSICTLGSIEGCDTEVQNALQRLVQDGTFTSKIALLSSNGEEQAVSLILAAIVWQGLVIDSPGGETWAGLVRSYPTLPTKTNEVLDRYFKEFHPITLIVKSYDSSYKMHDLAEALFTDRVIRHRLGTLNSKSVLSNFYQYSRLLPWGLRDDFAEQLSAYAKFWPNIQTMPWTEGIFETATLLNRQGGSAAKRIHSELVDRINSTSADEWSIAVSDGTEPFKIATKFVNRDDLKLGVGSTLLLSLCGLATVRTMQSKQARARWFELVELLTVPARKRALNDLRTAILAMPVGQIPSALKAGGARLLKEGGFESHPNETVEKIIVPLARSGRGRSWLADHKSELRNIVRSSSAGAREKLGRHISNLAESGGAGKKDWAQSVGTYWKI